MKKPTLKQLAARKKFAEMAKNGTLNKLRKKSKGIMNALDWGFTNEERNKNLDKYEKLPNKLEKRKFTKKLKAKNENRYR